MTDTGCKSVPPLFWSFSPSLRRACLLYFCNDFFLQFAFLNDISFLSENGLEWREGRCRSADKSAWDMSRHTAGYRSAEAVLRTNQDHFSAFAIVRFRSRNPVTFVVAKMVHGQAHKRSPPSRHVVDACRTGFWDAEDEELPYAVGSSEDGALTAALVTRSEKAVCVPLALGQRQQWRGLLSDRRLFLSVIRQNKASRGSSKFPAGSYNVHSIAFRYGDAAAPYQLCFSAFRNTDGARL